MKKDEQKEQEAASHTPQYSYGDFGSIEIMNINESVKNIQIVSIMKAPDLGI